MMKKALAVMLGVSERSLTAWQKEGFPVLEHGRRGKQNVYDLSACVNWIKKTGRGLNPRNGKHLIDLGRLDRELGLVMASAPATSPPARPPAVVFAEQMFEMAREALDEGSFDTIEPAMRNALSCVPEAQRHLMRLNSKVMDRLIVDVLAVVDEGEAELGNPRESGMSDAEAEAMGMFWYAVAAGEVVIANSSADVSNQSDKENES